MSSAPAVATADFETNVLKSDVPVLVDFWAPWCGPCRQIGPTIDAIAGEYEGRAKVYKVNTDTETEIAEKYNIMSIPSLLIFKEGKVVEQILGAVPKQVIVSKLDQAL